MTVEDAVSMGLGLGSNGDLITTPECCDWVLICKYPKVHIYMNVNSIFGSPRTFAYKYHFLNDDVCREFQKLQELSKAPKYVIEIKRYNSDFTSYTTRAAAYLDSRNQLISVKDVNHSSNIAPNSLDSVEAQWAKPLYAEGEDFIPYLKETMSKYFATH